MKVAQDFLKNLKKVGYLDLAKDQIETIELELNPGLRTMLKFTYLEALLCQFVKLFMIGKKGKLTNGVEKEINRLYIRNYSLILNIADIIDHNLWAAINDVGKDRNMIFHNLLKENMTPKINEEDLDKMEKKVNNVIKSLIVLK